MVFQRCQWPMHKTANLRCHDLVSRFGLMENRPIADNIKQDLKNRSCFLFLPAGLADLFIERTLLQRRSRVNSQLITFLG